MIEKSASVSSDQTLHCRNSTNKWSRKVQIMATLSSSLVESVVVTAALVVLAIEDDDNSVDGMVYVHVILYHCEFGIGKRCIARCCWHQDTGKNQMGLK